MSLEENSLVAAYQGRSQWEVDHHKRGWWQNISIFYKDLSNQRGDWEGYSVL